MSKSTVSVKWVEDILMAGQDSTGHSIMTGKSTGREPEWRGLKPSDLLLLAAASCTACDVVMILGKQKEPLVDLEVVCSGEQEADPPWPFTTMHLHYIVKGPVNPKKLERAIQLSEEKYCSVANTLKPALKITNDYEIIE